MSEATRKFLEKKPTRAARLRLIKSYKPPTSPNIIAKSYIILFWIVTFWDSMMSILIVPCVRDDSATKSEKFKNSNVSGS